MTCAWCDQKIVGSFYLRTGDGPHHKDCWLERTTP